MVGYNTHTRDKMALRFTEAKPNMEDFSAKVKLIHKSIVGVYGSNNIKLSRIFTNQFKCRYFYVYLNMPYSDKDEIINKIVDSLNGKISNNEFKISLILNAQMEKVLLVAKKDNKPSPSAPVIIVGKQQSKIKRPRIELKSTERESSKPIRVDINMDDLDEFLAFLETREPNRQRRERYKEALKSLYDKGWNEYKHSTFINEKRYNVNPKDVKIFINGLLTNDFKVSIKEYQESLELYIMYRWEKRYKAPKYQTAKDAPIPPVTKERKNGQDPEPQQGDEKGKKIFAVINHLQAWRSQQNDNDDIDDKASVNYEGGEVGSRKSITLQAASISEEDESVKISIDINKVTPITGNDGVDMNNEETEDNQSEEEMLPDTSTMENSIPEEAPINDTFDNKNESQSEETDIKPDNDKHTAPSHKKSDSMFIGVVRAILAPYKKLVQYIIKLFD